MNRATLTAARTRTSRPRRRVGPDVVPWLLGAGMVGVQIAFPLTGGGTPTLTVLAVVLFACASVGHALLTRGPGAAVGLVVVAGGGGLAAEAIGLATGLPFGQYAYTGSLGTAVLGVPLVVPAAWIMMAYPSLIVGRRLTAALGRGRGLTTVLGAWALATWDVFLDPQMVAEGYWTWTHPHPSLPGSPDVPLTNYLGWLLVAVLLMSLLDRVTPRERGDDLMPGVLYLWTYAAQVLGNLAFFGRPAVALLGGVAMGLVAVPYARSLRDG